MFISKIRASGDRSPFGDFWFTPVSSMTSSGMRVSAESALALPTAWACVRNIAEDFAKLPFRLYQPLGGEGRKQVTDHWLYRLFAKRPNQWQTPFEWREMLQGHLLLRGNAYCLIIDNARGEITDLVPLHPDRMRIEVLTNGDYRYRYTDTSGTQTVYRRDQIWHVKGLSPDGYFGYNPIDLQRQALGLGLAAQEYAARFFSNDARPSGGWIEFPGSFATKEARGTFRESWSSVQGGANRGKVAVLENGMKYHEVGINNKDSQFIETRKDGALGVCSMFRMPPHKVGILDKATFSNIEQQNIEYATDTQHSWCERWESSIESLLLDPESDTLEVEFDLRVLMRGDSVARATRAVQLVNAGILTRNEAREDEGYNPIDGLSEPLTPLNMTTDPAAGATVETPPAVDPDDADENSADARMGRLLRGSAERMARRVAADKPVSAETLADALAIPAAAAQAWLQEERAALSHDQLVASLVALGETT